MYQYLLMIGIIVTTKTCFKSWPGISGRGTRTKHRLYVIQDLQCKKIAHTHTTHICDMYGITIYIYNLYIYIYLYILVGGLEHDFYFSRHIGNNHPNWRTPSFFRGVGQPPTSYDTAKLRLQVIGMYYLISTIWRFPIHGVSQKIIQLLARQCMCYRQTLASLASKVALGIAAPLGPWARCFIRCNTSRGAKPMDKSIVKA